MYARCWCYYCSYGCIIRVIPILISFRKKIFYIRFFCSGFPNTTAVSAVNRQCSSGLTTVANIAAAIKAGYIDVGIGAGVESMTKYYGAGAVPMDLSSEVLELEKCSDV